MLSVIYAVYLKTSSESSYPPDYLTNLVARQTAALLDAFGYNPVLTVNPLRAGMLITIENKYSVNIVEGCNAASVIILFVSFILSFAEKFKKTFLFLLAGAVLIYIVNIIRIALLTIALYKYPQYQETLHSVLFPAVIYGMVFILWIVWVRTLKSTPAK